MPALDGIDTRALVRRLRERGAMRGVVTTERSRRRRRCSPRLRDFPPMAGRALVDEVTCARALRARAAGDGEARCHLAVYDFGIKTNILRSLLRARRARSTVLPARTPASRGARPRRRRRGALERPGRPRAAAPSIIESGARAGRRRHADASASASATSCSAWRWAARTFKLKFGHHGGNQPVSDLATGTVAITSQNHGFAVDPESLPAGCAATEMNLNDGTVEGFAVDGRPVLSVQYHPEAAPGPHDARRCSTASSIRCPASTPLPRGADDCRTAPDSGVSGARAAHPAAAALSGPLALRIAWRYLRGRHSRLLLDGARGARRLGARRDRHGASRWR